MDSLTIMEFDFPEYDNKTVENWRGRYEQSIIEGKKYIILYKPKTLLGSYLYDTPCKMKFKYLEDYQKMKKLEEKLSKINRKMDDREQPYGCGYQRVKDFVYELYSEMLDLEELVKQCNFLKVDCDDGRFYTNKFFGTNTFLTQAEFKFDVFNIFLRFLTEKQYVDIYEILKYNIIPR